LKAEFKAFVTDHFGAGYGDKSFTTQVSYIENGMDPQDIQALGCTIDEQKLSASQGPDALTVDLDFAPIKIIENGVDDNATPLVGAPAAA
jgi:hypothetical protein